MVGRYSAYRRGPDPVVSPNIIDRIMIGGCAAIWLVLVGVSVAAAVALADLGRGFHKTAGNPHTTWVLYAIIGVSALIIAGAIPVLLRARRMPQAPPVVRSTALQGRAVRRPPVKLGRSATPSLSGPSRGGAVTAVGAATEWSGRAVDRVWLRGTLALTSAIGVALISAALATYLMAAGHDGASWFCYALAGLVTVGTPAIEWLYVRRLRHGPATY